MLLDYCTCLVAPSQKGGCHKRATITIKGVGRTFPGRRGASHFWNKMVKWDMIEVCFFKKICVWFKENRRNFFFCNVDIRMKVYPVKLMGGALGQIWKKDFKPFIIPCTHFYIIQCLYKCHPLYESAIRCSLQNASQQSDSYVHVWTNASNAAKCLLGGTLSVKPQSLMS